MESDLQELDALEPTELDAGTVFSGTPSGKRVRGFAAPCRSRNQIAGSGAARRCDPRGQCRR